jgi:gamma-glutamyltranspeptidase/glutathione hydrolase
MNLAFADRDFYYGDPSFPPEEPIQGLLSKDYARSRIKLMDPARNNPDVKPGDPYPYMGKTNPFLHYLKAWPPAPPKKEADPESFWTGTTSIQAADEKGWVVSVTPSGGWVPAVIAGRTGIGLSQRAQSFVLDEAENPFNVIAPGKRPRATLTPGLALKGGKPYLSFAVQGGDTQDQNLLQFFLDIVEFGMNVQEACEAPNITSYQMRNSFDPHDCLPGKMDIHEKVPAVVRDKLKAMGYTLDVKKLTSGPINAIFFDQKHGTFWGGSSNYGDDYGVVW